MPVAANKVLLCNYVDKGSLSVFGYYIRQRRKISNSHSPATAWAVTRLGYQVMREPCVQFIYIGFNVFEIGTVHCFR